MMVKFDPSWLPPFPNIDFEQELWEVGLERVCGLDEAGRGALAGPVTAAALILPPDPKIVAATLFDVKWRPIRPNELEMISPYITGM